MYSGELYWRRCELMLVVYFFSHQRKMMIYLKAFYTQTLMIYIYIYIYTLSIQQDSINGAVYLSSLGKQIYGGAYDWSKLGRDWYLVWRMPQFGWFNSSPTGQNGRQFGSRYVKMHFREWKVLYFDKNFSEVCSQGPIDNNPALV